MRRLQIPFPRSLSKNLTKIVAVSVVLAVAFLLFFCHFDFVSDFHGIYILRCDRDRMWDIHNDLMLGEENRLLAKLEFQPLLALFQGKNHGPSAHLNYRWNERTGSGYIFNYSADGKQLLTCFSRFRDSQGKVPQGLFVGGGLPYSMHDDVNLTMSATGMAQYDGKEWHHVWCNVNETIASSPDVKYDPSTWKFLGSKVLHGSREKLVLESRHEVPFKGTVLRINRYAIFRAGENYFTLVIRVANAGTVPTPYYYVYGDEPWVGEFGTSVGNVGWTRDKLHFFEGSIDPWKESFAGMYDVGNPVILGESSNLGMKKGFTRLADFIEWIGIKPDLVYFSNKEGKYADEKQRVPLYSKDNRVIFLQWGPRLLRPEQPEYLILAIGMTDRVSASGVPVKPQVRLDPADEKLILAAEKGQS